MVYSGLCGSGSVELASVINMLGRHRLKHMAISYSSILVHLINSWLVWEEIKCLFMWTTEVATHYLGSKKIRKYQACGAWCSAQIAQNQV